MPHPKMPTAPTPTPTTSTMLHQTMTPAQTAVPATAPQSKLAVSRIPQDSQSPPKSPHKFTKHQTQPKQIDPARMQTSTIATTKELIQPPTTTTQKFLPSKIQPPQMPPKQTQINLMTPKKMQTQPVHQTDSATPKIEKTPMQPHPKQTQQIQPPWTPPHSMRTPNYQPQYSHLTMRSQTIPPPSIAPQWIAAVAMVPQAMDPHKFISQQEHTTKPMKKQRIEETAGYSTGEEKAHRAATKEPPANKFADMLARATAL